MVPAPCFSNAAFSVHLQLHLHLRPALCMVLLRCIHMAPNQPALYLSFGALLLSSGCAMGQASGNVSRHPPCRHQYSLLSKESIDSTGFASAAKTRQ